MRNIIKASGLPGASNSSARHFATLLALYESPVINDGAFNEIAGKIARKSLEAFDLAAAQIWRLEASWHCLAEAYSSQEKDPACPAPGNIMDPELAARTYERHFPAQDGPPVLIYRLIKPAQSQWSAEEAAFTAGYFNILRNALSIAQLRSENERLGSAKVSAEESNRSKTEFMANMSHELRTPLNSIIGFSEILAQEYFGAHSNTQYKDYAQDILHSGQHLLSLINDILDLSRIESGRQHLQEEAVKLDELIQAATRLLRERLGDKAQNLILEGETNLTLFAEARAIKQILVNLLSNAIKFTPQNGTITLSVSLSETVVIRVKDTGRGIAPDQMSRLFQPFSRGQEDQEATQEGVGLGLVISRKLARLHGGDLILHSEAGKGVTAVFCLPLDRLINDMAGVMPWEIQS